MEQKKKSLVQWRATRMERRFVTAIITAVSAEFFINLWTDNFRVSASVVLFPVLLLTLMRDCAEPGTGVVTGLMVLLVRSIVGMMSGVEFSYTVEMEYFFIFAMTSCCVYRYQIETEPGCPNCGISSFSVIFVPTCWILPCPDGAYQIWMKW